MAKVDIEAIRRKLAEMNNGGNGKTDFKRWSYDKPGEYKLRVLPWENTEPGVPYPTRAVYFGISSTPGKGIIVSPENAGLRDPIKEYRIYLFNEAKNKNEAEAAHLKEMAKQLQQKTMTCVCVVDRANEALGPQMWSPNWTDSQQLLSLYLTDCEDYSDVDAGCDLTLIVTEGKKKNIRTGRPILEAKISAARKNSPAAKDAATLKAWLDALPDIDKYYPITSTQETEVKLREWLDAMAGVDPKDAESDGTNRGGSPAKDSPVVGKLNLKRDEPAKASPKKDKDVGSKKPVLQQADDDLDRELADLDSQF